MESINSPLTNDFHTEIFDTLHIISRNPFNFDKNLLLKSAHKKERRAINRMPTCLDREKVIERMETSNYML